MSDTPPDQRVPVLKRIAYGFGALSDNFIMNGFGSMVTPIYNIGLKLDPLLVGWAVAIPRLIDAFIDPLMGNISDNTRSRWGRRRPYLVAGATLCALLLPLLWMPPVHTQNGMFLYLTLMGLAYFTCYTVYTIPYCALGFELTSDYNERTRLLAWPNYIGLLGSLAMPWLYPLALHAAFPNEVVGARWVSVALGLLIVLLGLATMASLGLYINIYYVYGGDKAAAAQLSAVAGSLVAGLSYVSVWMATVLSTHFGKRHAANVGLGLSLIGAISCWWTLSPERPYLQLISASLTGIGLQGCWMLFISMIGDVCEEDELQTGMRREGIYSSVGGLSRKAAVAAAAVGTGLVLKVCGFDAEIAEKVGAPLPVVLSMKTWFVFGQAGFLVLAMFLLRFYPITRARAEKTQRLLRERRKNPDC